VTLGILIPLLYIVKRREDCHKIYYKGGKIAIKEKIGKVTSAFKFLLHCVSKTVLNYG